MLDANSPIAIGDLEESNSSVTTDELQVVDNKIDIYHSLYIPDAIAFPAEDFFKVPFTHHSRILAGAKTLEARYYYIHRTAEENLSVEALQTLLKENAYERRNTMPSNFTNTLPDAKLARKAVMMFKDEYLLVSSMWSRLASASPSMWTSARWSSRLSKMSRISS